MFKAVQRNRSKNSIITISKELRINPEDLLFLCRKNKVEVYFKVRAYCDGEIIQEIVFRYIGGGSYRFRPYFDDGDYTWVEVVVKKSSLYLMDIDRSILKRKWVVRSDVPYQQTKSE